ncbi:MAG: glycosyltransferase family 2 protein [Gemmatimonadota bacterium]
MSSQPRVSVIVPTRDRADLLLRAVQSVLRQSFTDLEVLICFDGAADEARGRVAALRGPVRLIELPPSGLPGRVRNGGLAEAGGELIAFLDDDDEWSPTRLALQVALLDASRDTGIVYTDARLRYEDGSLSPPVLADRHKRGGALLDALIDDCFIHPSTVLVRRTVLADAGGFDDDLPIAEDYDLWLRIARVTRGACIAEPLATIGRSHASSSGRRRRLAYELSVRVLERALARGMTPLQRLRCRRSLARLGTRAGFHALSEHDADAAAAFARAALRHHPLHRPAWSLLWRSRNGGGGRQPTRNSV